MGFSRQEYWSGVPLPSLSLLPTATAIKMKKLRPREVKKLTVDPSAGKSDSVVAPAGTAGDRLSEANRGSRGAAVSFRLGGILT